MSQKMSNNDKLKILGCLLGIIGIVIICMAKTNGFIALGVFLMLCGNNMEQRVWLVQLITKGIDSLINDIKNNVK